MLSPITLKILSFTESKVGLILRSDGGFNFLPLNLPDIILIIYHHIKIIK